MTDWGEVLTVLGVAAAVITFLGAAYAGFRATVLRATIVDQERRITNLVGEVADKGRELATEQTERRLLESRLSLMEERYRHLEEVVSGRIDFAAFETALATAHAEQMRRLDEVCDAIDDVKAMVGNRRGTAGGGA